MRPEKWQFQEAGNLKAMVAEAGEYEDEKAIMRDAAPLISLWLIKRILSREITKAEVDAIRLILDRVYPAVQKQEVSGSFFVQLQQALSRDSRDSRDKGDKGAMSGSGEVSGAASAGGSD